MKSYRVLYYHWGETSRDDCVEGMRALGFSVTVWAREFANYTQDEAFAGELREVLRAGYDCIFSFNYIPLLSEQAMEAGILYLAWIHDSPHYTLESQTLANPCNRIFLFDYALAERYRSEGFDTVDYLPLACNASRLDRMLEGKRGGSGAGYRHEVTFLGSLYNDEYDFFGQIGYLPDFLRGYLEAVICAQEQLYGIDLPSELMTPELCGEMGKYVKADLGEGFRSCRDEILRNMIRKKVTVSERWNLLRMLGERFPVDLYSGREPEDLPVRYLGYADYRTQMPEIFATSKINLNISLRSIRTGIPLRVIDILGAGGFCLTNYQAELPEYFENGRELVWFESPEDLAEKAAYYLAHDAERERIAEVGREIARREFSYAVQLPRLFERAFGAG